MPTFPPSFPAVVLLEALFGFGYDQLVKWAHLNKLWHVSISVAIGVTVTMGIFTAATWNEQLPSWNISLLLFICFIASGLPMMIGSMRGTVKESHKRKRLPTSALKIIEDVIMENHVIANEISMKTKNGQIHVQDMADLVNRLHNINGSLKTL